MISSRTDGSRAAVGSGQNNWVMAGVISQLLLMLFVVYWNFRDPRLERLSLLPLLQFKTAAANELTLLPEFLCLLMSGILWFAILCVAVSVSALFWANGAYRSIRYIGLLCILFALWLSIYVQWEQIAWLGHRHRASVTVKRLMPLAQQLSQEWPKYDGQSEHLGPFMAYPNGRPSTLILLTPMSLGHDGVRLAAVDRDKDGTLRFELSRGDESLWLEWSPQNRVRKTSFVDGVGGSYRQQRTIAIDRNWTVARYE
ncbi:MAG: hypothetical protein NXI32_23320 [bacterium]|nr:hypothetical protein [bacterium]